MDWLGQGLSFSQDRSQCQNRTRQGSLKNQRTGVKLGLLILHVVEQARSTTGRRKQYLETQGNRITSPPANSHQSYHSAGAARSSSTAPTAAPGKCRGRQSRAPLCSSCTQGLAKFNVKNSNQLSHSVIICRPVWRCSLMECTEGEPLTRGKSGCRQARLQARGLLPFSPIVAENSSRHNFC